MSRVYFLSTDELQEYSTINYNVENKLLENAIFDAQIIDIQKIIGTRLYKSLETKIIDGSITGTTNSDYKELLDDYIFYTLLKSSQVRSMLFLYAKIRNKGVVNQNDEASSSVDIEILNKMKAEIKNDYEFYANKLKNYLCEKKFTEYQNYNPDSLDYYDKPDKSDSYFSGIQLDYPLSSDDWRNKN